MHFITFSIHQWVEFQFQVLHYGIKYLMCQIQQDSVTNKCAKLKSPYFPGLGSELRIALSVEQ